MGVCQKLMLLWLAVSGTSAAGWGTDWGSFENEFGPWVDVDLIQKTTSHVEIPNKNVQSEKSASWSKNTEEHQKLTTHWKTERRAQQKLPENPVPSSSEWGLNGGIHKFNIVDKSKIQKQENSGKQRKLKRHLFQVCWNTLSTDIIDLCQRLKMKTNSEKKKTSKNPKILTIDWKNVIQRDEKTATATKKQATLVDVGAESDPNHLFFRTEGFSRRKTQPSFLESITSSVRSFFSSPDWFFGQPVNRRNFQNTLFHNIPFVSNKRLKPASSLLKGSIKQPPGKSKGKLVN